MLAGRVGGAVSMAVGRDVRAQFMPCRVGAKTASIQLAVRLIGSRGRLVV